MRGFVLPVVLAAAVAVTGPAVAGGARPGTATPGAQLWVSRFPARGSSEPVEAEVVSPDGATVFVTAASSGGRPPRDAFQTVAYSAKAGRPLWASRYHGPGKLLDGPSAIAMSQGGGTVFVTGSSGRDPNFSYATAAYNAKAGRQLWASRYHGKEKGFSFANAMAVSPDGRTVFVTGSSHSRGDFQASDYATVAYNAATGRQRWVSRYHPGVGFDQAESVAVSPGGRTVFVTGRLTGKDGTSPYNYGTIAYNATTGRQLWASRYHGPGFGARDPISVKVSPSGQEVYVTGAAFAAYATVAYNAATGKQLWASRYKNAFATSMAVSPDGRAIFVTGDRHDGSYATVAYNAATGKQLWARRYHGNGAASIAVSPHGTTVYVTGGSKTAAYATIAYNAATGRQEWTRLYHGPANKGGACCIAFSPRGTAVFVTGLTQVPRRTGDYTTIAYHS
jgi:outer membrane protein assembly factor BamB